jgi:hypothetical protein
MEIKGPNGNVLNVTSENRAAAVSAGADLQLVNAVESGLAYTLFDATVTPTGAGDYFCKMANTTEDTTMVVFACGFTNAAAENMNIVTSANYVSATSHGEVEPASRAPGGPLASLYGQFEVDVDITGQPAVQTVRTFVSGAGTVYTAKDDPFGLNAAPIYLNYGQALSMSCDTGTAAITNLSLDFYIVTTPLS